jgi:hypothetical protein
MAYRFNPFTGTLDLVDTATPDGTVIRVVATGATLTIPDTYSLVVADYFAVEGTGILVVEGDGVLAVL